MRKSILSLLLAILILPVSIFAEDIASNETQHTITYSKSITKDVVLNFISQLDLTLFYRGYFGGNLYDDWKYESAPYIKTHNYLNKLFLEQIKPSVNETTFFSDNFYTKVHLNLLRAYNSKDKIKLKSLMTNVSRCYNKNKDKVSKYVDEKTFLNTQCIPEMNKVDDFLLVKIQNRLKAVPLISTK
ncbi:hypothetical protein HOO68_04880 [Candidatus Gracilibacteria bacterium]|nr:hypothetical protein [Candidatus Gracilibacteria bacterium]